MQQQTLAMVKPGAMFFLPYVFGVYGNAGLCVVRFRTFRFDKSLAKELYAEHKERPFFKTLVEYMTSESCAAIVLEDVAIRADRNLVALVRELNGATNPQDADYESIRGHLRHHFKTTNPAANFVHGSDSPEAAQREINLLFS